MHSPTPFFLYKQKSALSQYKLYPQSLSDAFLSVQTKVCIVTVQTVPSVTLWRLSFCTNKSLHCHSTNFTLSHSLTPFFLYKQKSALSQYKLYSQSLSDAFLSVQTKVCIVTVQTVPSVTLWRLSFCTNKSLHCHSTIFTLIHCPTPFFLYKQKSALSQYKLYPQSLSDAFLSVQTKVCIVTVQTVPSFTLWRRSFCTNKNHHCHSTNCTLSHSPTPFVLYKQKSALSQYKLYPHSLSDAFLSVQTKVTIVTVQTLPSFTLRHFSFCTNKSLHCHSTNCTLIHSLTPFFLYKQKSALSQYKLYPHALSHSFLSVQTKVCIVTVQTLPSVTLWRLSFCTNKSLHCHSTNCTLSHSLTPFFLYKQKSALSQYKLYPQSLADAFLSVQTKVCFVTVQTVLSVTLRRLSFCTNKSLHCHSTNCTLIHSLTPFFLYKQKSALSQYNLYPHSLSDAFLSVQTKVCIVTVQTVPSVTLWRLSFCTNKSLHCHSTNCTLSHSLTPFFLYKQKSALSQYKLYPHSLSDAVLSVQTKITIVTVQTVPSVTLRRLSFCTNKSLHCHSTNCTLIHSLTPFFLYKQKSPLSQYKLYPHSLSDTFLSVQTKVCIVTVQTVPSFTLWRLSFCTNKSLHCHSTNCTLMHSPTPFFLYKQKSALSQYKLYPQSLSDAFLSVQTKVCIVTVQTVPSVTLWRLSFCTNKSLHCHSTNFTLSHSLTPFFLYKQKSALSQYKLYSQSLSDAFLSVQTKVCIVTVQTVPSFTLWRLSFCTNKSLHCHSTIFTLIHCPTPFFLYKQKSALSQYKLYPQSLSDAFLSVQTKVCIVTVQTVPSFTLWRRSFCTNKNHHCHSTNCTLIHSPTPFVLYKQKSALSQYKLYPHSLSDAFLSVQTKVCIVTVQTVPSVTLWRLSFCTNKSLHCYSTNCTLSHSLTPFFLYKQKSALSQYKLYPQSLSDSFLSVQTKVWFVTVQTVPSFTLRRLSFCTNKSLHCHSTNCTLMHSLTPFFLYKQKSIVSQYKLYPQSLSDSFLSVQTKVTIVTVQTVPSVTLWRLSFCTNKSLHCHNTNCTLMHSLTLFYLYKQKSALSQHKLYPHALSDALLSVQTKVCIVTVQTVPSVTLWRLSFCRNKSLHCHSTNCTLSHSLTPFFLYKQKSPLSQYKLYPQSLSDAFLSVQTKVCIVTVQTVPSFTLRRLSFCTNKSHHCHSTNFTLIHSPTPFFLYKQKSALSQYKLYPHSLSDAFLYKQMSALSQYKLYPQSLSDAFLSVQTKVCIVTVQTLPSFTLWRLSFCTNKSLHCHSTNFTLIHSPTPFFLYKQKSALHNYTICCIHTFILRFDTLIHICQCFL